MKLDRNIVGHFRIRQQLFVHAPAVDAAALLEHQHQPLAVGGGGFDVLADILERHREPILLVQSVVTDDGGTRRNGRQDDEEQGA